MKRRALTMTDGVRATEIRGDGLTTQMAVERSGGVVEIRQEDVGRTACLRLPLAHATKLGWDLIELSR